MKRKRIMGFIAIFLLFISTVMPVGVSAKAERNINDESIYDLLVDRYNNGDRKNDLDVDIHDDYAFHGGDFVGIEGRLQHIIEMGFTMISIGPVFKSESYDGNKALSYSELDPHFGTDDELTDLVKEIHKQKMKVIADFPLSKVSADHEWTKNRTHKFTHSADGTVNWDPADSKVREDLIAAVVGFITTYDLDGIRLTQLDGFDDAYLNEMIAAIHDAREGSYVLTNEDSGANFDSTPSEHKMEALRQTFMKVDPDSAPIDVFKDNDEGRLIQFDDLTGPRLTYDMVEARMFPPTRWKVAATALFTLPGVPLMTYGTEIAVNGKEAPESHPLFNFKTDMEFKELIGNLNILRNKSETLRNGEFEMLHNEDGFIVYKRSSKDETWIIAVNNTSKTANFEIPSNMIGEKKKLRGVLDGDLIRESDDGVFRVVLDRELAEVYIADDDKGFNTPYLIASILVYVIFLGFLFLVIKKGRARRKSESKKA
ncbi:alpha-amylase family glycosyl hydrolase [Sporosarcina highlanderae]|uniref:Alpha-amylase family glycosyl hydrolase n=1 Tax=Sporosarcina highlanderae TaxID=3035916 RepID=A0ABT8JNX6_9BACL|nr:alpha-amylase family glycosyl hydrolase [Sporosarcina highlanderae]MDN4606850.1 alpha-amylase family glycosyl hydrolase [Sporosarcina highlanderae]